MSMRVVGDMIRWNDATYYARDICQCWVFVILKQLATPMADPILFLTAFRDEVDKQKAVVMAVKNKPVLQTENNRRVEKLLQANVVRTKQLRSVTPSTKKQELELASLRNERKQLQKEIGKTSLTAEEKEFVKVETAKWKEGYDAFYKLKWIIDMNLYHVVFHLV